MIIKNEIYIKSIIHPSPRYARIIKILASQEHVTKRDINFYSTIAILLGGKTINYNDAYAYHHVTPFV